MKIDIIIQGGLWPSTIKTAAYYSSHEMVKKVIVSTWESETIEEEIPPNVTLLKNKLPDYIGPGNLNLHLLSSKNGLAECESEIVLKVRSDEKISHEGLINQILYLSHSLE